MGNLKLADRNLGRIFNYRLLSIQFNHRQLKVENSAQATFRFYPVSFRAPRLEYLSPKSFYSLIICVDKGRANSTELGLANLQILNQYVKA